MSLLFILSVISTTTKHWEHSCGDNSKINPRPDDRPKVNDDPNKNQVGTQCHIGQPSQGHPGTQVTITQVTEQVNNIHKGWVPIVKNIWTESQVAKHGYETRNTIISNTVNN